MSSFESIRFVDVAVPPRRRCNHCRAFASVYAWRVNGRRMPVRYCASHAEVIIPGAALAAAGMPTQATLGFDPR